MKTEADKQPVTVEFQNESIVITDPAYVMKYDDLTDEPYESDWGEDMTKIGYTKCHTSHNGVGDGSWNVVNKDGTKLGEIWADSGEVGVFLAKEVDRHCGLETVGGAVVIENFTGTVSFNYRKIEHHFSEGEPFTSTYLVLRCSGKTSNGREIEFTVDYGE